MSCRRPWGQKLAGCSNIYGLIASCRASRTPPPLWVAPPQGGTLPKISAAKLARPIGERSSYERMRNF